MEICWNKTVSPCVDITLEFANITWSKLPQTCLHSAPAQVLHDTVTQIYSIFCLVDWDRAWHGTTWQAEQWLAIIRNIETQSDKDRAGLGGVHICKVTPAIRAVIPSLCPCHPSFTAATNTRGGERGQSRVWSAEWWQRLHLWRMRQRAVRLRVLSARHQDMTGDEAIINYLGQTGAGAWDNKIFTMWVHCQLGGTW